MSCCPTRSNRRGPKIVAILGAAVLLVGAVVASQRAPSTAGDHAQTGDDARPPLVSTAPAADDPSEVVSRMIQAASEGRVEDYLACFSGDLARQMNAGFQGADRERLARSLRQSMARLKGFSIVKSNEASADPATVRVLVELIFADHHQRQHAALHKESGVWRIASLENPQVLIPEILYGTPVAEEVPADAQPVK